MVRNKIVAFLAAAALLSVSAVSADAPYTDQGSLTTALPSIISMTHSA